MKHYCHIFRRQIDKEIALKMFAIFACTDGKIMFSIASCLTIFATLLAQLHQCVLIK